MAFIPRHKNRRRSAVRRSVQNVSGRADVCETRSLLSASPIAVVDSEAIDASEDFLPDVCCECEGPIELESEVVEFSPLDGEFPVGEDGEPLFRIMMMSGPGDEYLDVLDWAIDVEPSGEFSDVEFYESIGPESGMELTGTEDGWSTDWLYPQDWREFSVTAVGPDGESYETTVPFPEDYWSTIDLNLIDSDESWEGKENEEIYEYVTYVDPVPDGIDSIDSVNEIRRTEIRRTEIADTETDDTETDDIKSPELEIDDSETADSEVSPTVIRSLQDNDNASVEMHFFELSDVEAVFYTLAADMALTAVSDSDAVSSAVPVDVSLNDSAADDSTSYVFAGLNSSDMFSSTAMSLDPVINTLSEDDSPGDTSDAAEKTPVPALRRRMFGTRLRQRLASATAENLEVLSPVIGDGAPSGQSSEESGQRRKNELPMEPAEPLGNGEANQTTAPEYFSHSGRSSIVELAKSLRPAGAKGHDAAIGVRQIGRVDIDRFMMEFAEDGLPAV